MKNVIIIPARLNSSRLPEKVLLEINHKSILERVFDKCKQVNNSDIYIATDSNKIYNHCSKFTKNIILTSKQHESGTDRIAEAIQNIECENVINVQGDEPLINPDLIIQIFNELENNNSNVVSAIEKITSFDELKNNNNVKVVINKFNQALYFSRNIIPFERDNNYLNQTEKDYFNEKHFYKHIGVYGFKKKTLIEYSNFKKSKLESIEKLEQLRFLDNGINIKLVHSKNNSLGIDTIDDFNKVKKIIFQNEIK